MGYGFDRLRFERNLGSVSGSNAVEILTTVRWKRSTMLCGANFDGKIDENKVLEGLKRVWQMQRATRSPTT